MTETEKRSGGTERRDVSHPGMMGDGTMEQDLNEKGDPKARISKEEVQAAFPEKEASADTDKSA